MTKTNIKDWATIAQWLDSINATSDEIDSCFNQCSENKDDLIYYLRRASIYRASIGGAK